MPPDRPKPWSHPPEKRMFLEEKQKTPVHQEVDETKVINSINRLKLRTTPRSKHRLCVVVTTSERRFFESETPLKSFGVSVSFGKSEFRLTDSIMSVSGNSESVARAGICIAFHLTRLNNFVKNELYTLKSFNYKITIISSTEPTKIHHVAHTNRIAHLSLFEQYNGLTPLVFVTVKSDFHSLFDFLAQLDPGLEITEFGTVLTSNDAELFKRSEQQETKLTNLIKKAIAFAKE